MNTKKPDRVSIIGRGFAGWHAAGIDHNGNRFSSSGGELLSRPWGAERAPGYLSRADPGTPVYDAEKADPDALYRWVFRGPHADPAIPEGCVSTGWPHRPSDAVPLELVGALTSGQHVAPDVYVRALFHAVTGVRVGVVAGSGKTLRVEWDDGTTTPYA